MKKYFAELIGTLVLVFVGCGSVAFSGYAAGACGDGIGSIGIAFAFGLSVVAMAYAIGGISGCHINPAITLGVFLAGRMKGKDACLYVVFQIIGAILGSALLYALIATGDVEVFSTTGANSLQDGATVGQGFLAETIFTCLFVLVVLGATDAKKGCGNLAGLVIGLTLVLAHFVCLPITGTSLNPARSIGPALFAGGAALSQLWIFIVAPLLGGAISALIWKLIGDK